jgi:predicted  nucleic acid-binding Zn-ribbon protein
MPRLDKLEAGVASLNRAMVQVSEILLDQNQRLDRLGSAQQGTNERLARLESAQQGTNERLDRLIELQTRSYTDWVDRHQSQEQRLLRLEERVDRLEK